MGPIRQALGVFKKRTGEHERSIRELLVSARGVSVGEPLSEFRGIMTGVPHYEGAVESSPKNIRQNPAGGREA